MVKYFLILLFLFNCKSFIKPNLFEFKSKVEAIERDNKFLTSFSKEGVHWKEEDSKGLEELDYEKADFFLQNKFAVNSAKKVDIDPAEEIWKSRLKNYPYDKVSILNLMRLHYLLEDYDATRKILNQIFKENPPTKEYVLTIMDWLKKDNRLEENIIFLDVVSGFAEFEINALEEIGNYFLSVNDIPKARIYFERILTIYAFHDGALSGMIKVNCFEEKWNDALIYGTTILKLNSSKDFRGYLLEAYYRTGKYREGLSLINSTPSKFKHDKLFLKTWKDILLSVNPNESLSPLKPYFSKNSSERELYDFFYFNSKDGKQLNTNVFQGL